MGNALAVFMGTERQRTTPDFIKSGRKRTFEVPDLAADTQEMNTKREIKAIMAAIDKEMTSYKSLAELDFRAGYMTGKIYEKEAVGLITPGHRDALIGILYAKYETIRGLEIGGAGCNL